MVDPVFLKSTVTFVDVPDVGGSGEIACREMAGDEAGVEDDDGVGDGAGVGDEAGVGEEDGVEDDDGVGDEDGLLGPVGIGLGEAVPPPAAFTENELVARPAPPCHSSKPASTSIRYHEVLM
jgi:hypothetical protein